MPEEIIKYNIPNGYKLIKKSVFMDIDDAVSLLITKKQRKFTKAIRTDNYTAELIKDIVVCPHCGHETPSYIRQMNKIYGKKGVFDDNVSKPIIKAWGTKQFSLFPQAPQELLLTEYKKPYFEFVCPKCQRKSTPANNERLVIIRHNNKKISICCEIADLKELLSLPLKTAKTLDVNFPLYEQVTFNLKNGHTYIELKNNCDILKVRDITHHPELFEKSITNRVLSSNTRALRAVNRFFKAHWKTEFPFKSRELEPALFSLLTKFVGFSAEFYNAVPYEKTSDLFSIDSEFKGISKKLHTPHCAIKLLENSKLPKCKSVKKAIFQNAGLLFYIPELEQIWNIINDPNLFVTLLICDSVYGLLSFLHQRPVTIAFIADLCEVRGKRFFIKNICHWESGFENYATAYCSLSESLQKRARENWNKLIFFSGADLNLPEFSIPMHKIENRITNCIIDGFFFFWVKNRREYCNAAINLNNCLGEWKAYKNPVVCVKRISDGEFVAAIEVSKNEIIQARAHSNDPLSDVKGLEEAYEKWKNLFSLKECEDFELDIDELIDNIINDG